MSIELLFVAPRSLDLVAKDLAAERHADILEYVAKAGIVQPLKPWERIDLDQVTGAARTWLSKAQMAGGEVKAVRAGNAVMLVVKTPRIRATWLDGRTMGVTDGARKYTLAEALEAIGAAS